MKGMGYALLGMAFLVLSGVVSAQLGQVAGSVVLNVPVGGSNSSTMTIFNGGGTPLSYYMIPPTLGTIPGQATPTVTLSPMDGTLAPYSQQVITVYATVSTSDNSGLQWQGLMQTLATAVVSDNGATIQYGLGKVVFVNSIPIYSTTTSSISAFATTTICHGNEHHCRDTTTTTSVSTSTSSYSSSLSSSLSTTLASTESTTLESTSTESTSTLNTTSTVDTTTQNTTSTTTLDTTTTIEPQDQSSNPSPSLINSDGGIPCAWCEITLHQYFGGSSIIRYFNPVTQTVWIMYSDGTTRNIGRHIGECTGASKYTYDC